MVDPLKRLQVALVILGAILVVGTGGYMIIEGWPLTDSLYMTVITLSTIGFREVHEMDTGGRVFTIVLILGGVGTAAYALKAAVQILLEGEIREVLGRRKVNEKINKLKEHYIICGYGRMGKQVCAEFASAGCSFVVIEKNPDVVAEIQEKDVMVIQGDATHDEVMISAGIERAQGMITVLNTDADNLFVVLSARDMNPGLKIITRADEEGSEKKLKRAGADLVVSPYTISAMKIVNTIFRPHISSFLESAVRRDGDIDFRLESIRIAPGSPYDQVPIGQSRVREDLGILILAIQKAAGQVTTRVTPKTVLEGGDLMICVGNPTQLEALKQLAGHEKGASLTSG